MSIKLLDNTSQANGLGINTDHEAKVALTMDETKAGYAILAGEPDAGTVTGSRDVKPLDVSDDYRLRTGMDTPLFNEWFPGSAVNTTLYSQNLTTMTVTQAGGWINLNAGNSVASAAVARVQTYRSFPVLGTFGVSAEFIASIPFAPVANNVTEWGLGIATGTSAPTDGAFFRLNATGEFRCVINNNGTESQSVALDFNALVGANIAKHFIIVLGEDNAVFWIDDVQVAVVSRPNNAPSVVSSGNLPILMRTYNSSATAQAQQLKVGMINVTLLDADDGKQWHYVLGGAGANSHQGQTGGTLGSTALYTNSLAAGAGAAATNTTAALGSGLGGQFTLQPTLAANTDGIISSYQVPLGTSILPGRSLYILGVKISGIVSAALTGGPVLGLWSLAFGHTAVSLATAEAATTKAPRRVPLGIQTVPVTAALGVQADREIQVNFQVPICVQPGEFVQTVLKNIGTVTSAGTITFLITFDGYWE